MQELSQKFARPIAKERRKENRIAIRRYIYPWCFKVENPKETKKKKYISELEMKTVIAKNKAGEVSSSSLSSQGIRDMNSLVFKNARKVMDSSISSGVKF